MSPEQFRASEGSSGVASALFALVETLDAKGILKFEDYRSTLHRLWDEMPEDDAGGGTGFVFERIIDLLNTAVAQRKP